MSSHKRNIFILIFIGLLLEIGLIVTVLDYNKADHSKDVRTEHCGLFFDCGSPYTSRYCDPGPCLPSGYPQVAQQELKKRIFITTTYTYNFVINKIISNDLVGQWTFNKRAETQNIQDFSSFHNDGTLIGPAWPRQSSEQGAMLDGFLDFKNDGDRIEVPNSSSLIFNKNDDISIFAWIRPHRLNQYNEVVVKGRTQGTSDTNYALRVGNGVGKENKLVFYYLDVYGAWHTYQSVDDVVPLDKWSLIAVSYKFGQGKNIKLYVNGAEEKGTWTSGDGNAEPMFNPAPLWIGSIYDSNTSHWTFDGLIADVNIYRKIITKNEVSTLFNYAKLPDGYYINE